MAELGAYLSRLREEHGLSIDELARVTRVAPRYLDALEREDFEALPAPVFTKGYIRAYCQALSASPDEALARFADSAAVAAPAPAAKVPEPMSRSDAGTRARGTLLVSFVLLVAFGLALFGVALVQQAGRPEIGARRAEAPVAPVEPAAVPVTAPSSGAAATSPPAGATAEPSPAPSQTLVPPGPPAVATTAPAAPPVAPAPASRPLEAKVAPPAETRPPADASRTMATVAEPPPLRLGSVVSPYRLVARTLESTWLRVRTEDGRATEETIPAGEVREWISNRPFVLTIGNAAGVALELNGQKLPLLGARGAVIGRLTLPPAEP